MRRAKLTPGVSVLFLLFVLVGCASTGGVGPVLDRAHWEAVVRARGVDPSDVFYPFETTPEMERFAREVTAGAVAPLPRLATLQRALFDPRSFPFAYDAPVTSTPPRTFVERRGNCLSFTVLFVALARSLGYPVQLYSVQRILGARKVESLVIVNRHVVAGYRHAGRLYVYDFSRLEKEFVGRYVPVDDVAVAGLFHTNIGAARLQAGDLEGARRELLIATRLAPNFGGAWVNLGVVERSRGDMDAAFAAYERALEVEPGNASALTNIAYLHTRLGHEDQARAALAAAARGRTSPYSLVALADIEMARGNLKAARRLLGRARRAAHGRIPEVYEALARLAGLRGDAAGQARYAARARRLRRVSGASTVVPR